MRLTIKDIRNYFILKKEIGDNTGKHKKYFWTKKKILKHSKNRIIRDIRKIFEYEEDYYKPVRAGDLWSNNYFEYESIGDRTIS